MALLKVYNGSVQARPEVSGEYCLECPNLPPTFQHVLLVNELDSDLRVDEVSLRLLKYNRHRLRGKFTQAAEPV